MGRVFFALYFLAGKEGETPELNPGEGQQICFWEDGIAKMKIQKGVREKKWIVKASAGRR